jgi:aminopeptidase N
MAHELGHQWYGDLLTTRDWGDVWLNEGFATFMEQIFREEDLGVDEGAFDRLGAQEQTIDADRRTRRPIVWNKWVNDPIEVFFSGHIYPKGATILQMLRHQLGDDLFWKAMNHYTTANAYGTVVTDDLRKAFEETTGKDYKAFFNQWVYGAGFPVFQVSSLYDRAAGRLVISAKEVQPRDSLTGFFDVDVDVEARTDSGVVRFVVPVRNGTGEAGTNLKAPPRSIRWNKGNWILDITDFPRSTAMLRYQLVYDDDVLGRIEAVDVLAQRPADQAALIGADRLTDVREDRVDRGAILRPHSEPCDPSRVVGPPRDRVPGGGKTIEVREVRQWTEHRLVRGAKSGITREKMCRAQPIARHLRVALYRRQRLRPKRVGSTVPEVPAVVTHVPQ